MPAPALPAENTWVALVGAALVVAWWEWIEGLGGLLV
jgi:hypothetical protein